MYVCMHVCACVGGVCSVMLICKCSLMRFADLVIRLLSFRVLLFAKELFMKYCLIYSFRFSLEIISSDVHS